MSDVTFDFTNGNEMTVHNNVAEPWKVTLVDTGLNTQTGGRIKHVQKYIGDEPFFMTYGDGESDINIRELLAYHETSLLWKQCIRKETRLGWYGNEQ